jgi:hypothetical protein
MTPLVRRIVAEHRTAVLALTLGLVVNVLAYIAVVRPLARK